MKSVARQLTHHAVVFFDGERLVKEMLYAEFEAVLDQVVGLQDFAGREMRACFLRINGRHQLLGTVFFLVDFDADGFVSRSWNLPLRHLLDKSERGPDLGAGRIRLGCQSQCPVAWHRRQLWDPQLDGDGNTFGLLAKAVERNRLGLPLVAEEVADPLTVATGAGADPILHQETVNAQFALRLAAVHSEAQQQAEQLHQHYRIQLNEVRSALESTKQLFRDEKQRNRLLHERLAQQEAEVGASRRAVERDLAQRGDTAELDALRQRFELELKLSVERETAGLHEMLNMREVELFYREEQLGNLRDEVARLRQERDRLIQRGSARLLELLNESAVTLVVYSPGGEAISLPAAAIADYLEDPAAWLAAKLNVSRELFEAWRRHCAAPMCSGVDGGASCGAPLAPVAHASQFLAGVSDRCEHHQEIPTLEAALSY